MEIKLKHQISGTRDGEDWPAPGTIVDLPDDEAKTLLKNGDAVLPDVELPASTGALTTGAVPPEAETEPEVEPDGQPATEPDAEQPKRGRAKVG